MKKLNEISFFDKEVEADTEIQSIDKNGKSKSDVQLELEYKLKKFKIEQNNKIKNTALGVFMAVASLLAMHYGVPYAGWALFVSVLIIL